MPNIAGFTNDIYISFSYADNWDGWVEKFQDFLRHRLVQIGVPATIWRESKLRGPDVFSDEIFRQLQQSALLISIISPAGIQSRWCEDERQTFQRFADLNGGFRIDRQSRALKVVKTPLTADQHRDLFGVLGYEFYARDMQSNRFREFDQFGPEFCRTVDNLAQDIKHVLDAFRQHLKAALQKETIYVATTTSDLRRGRDAIVQQLEVWGCSVVPQDSEPPHRFASFQAIAKAELGASMLAVHLVSDQPQPILEGAQDSITGQYELAQSLHKNRIVWIEPGRPLYSKFDDALKNGLQSGVEILQDCSIEDLKDVIEERLYRQRLSAPLHKSEAKVELNSIRDRREHTSPEASHTDQQAIRILEKAVETKTLDPRWAPRKLFTIDEYRRLYDAAMNAPTAAAKGHTLEDLTEYMFLCVPGLETKARDRRTLAEEIDLAFSNQGDGFWRQVDSPFIVECRNLSSPVSAKMIRDFVGKMHTKGMRTGFIVTTSHVTKEGMIVQRQALMDAKTVVSLEGKDLFRIYDGENLLRVFEDRYFDCRLL